MEIGELNFATSYRFKRITELACRKFPSHQTSQFAWPILSVVNTGIFMIDLLASLKVAFMYQQTQCCSVLHVTKYDISFLVKTQFYLWKSSFFKLLFFFLMASNKIYNISILLPLIRRELYYSCSTIAYGVRNMIDRYKIKEMVGELADELIW